MPEKRPVEWLTSLAPVLSPIFGMTGVLGGAWLVYRGNQRKHAVDSVQTMAQPAGPNRTIMHSDAPAAA